MGVRRLFSRGGGCLKTPLKLLFSSKKLKAYIHFGRPGGQGPPLRTHMKADNITLVIWKQEIKRKDLSS